MYLLIKYIHVSTAVLSIAGFFVRGIGHWRRAGWITSRAARVLPHVNDTLLLSAAVALSIMSRQYPLRQDWLTAKVIALVIYILLGMVAFRFGRTRGQRVGAWLAALLTAGYIVMTALTRDPWWFVIH